VPAIELMSWDSRMLDLQAGRAIGSMPPPQSELDAFDMVLARIAMSEHDVIASYQHSGFDFVALDLSLSADTLNSSMHQGVNDYSISWHSRKVPDFAIKGFNIADSRLMLDARCRNRLASEFWDSVVTEHCTDYADMVACALDKDGKRLLGFISCLLHGTTLDLFLVAVHPDCQSQGIGSSLLNHIAVTANERGWKLSTQVLASNMKAMNFYMQHGFNVSGGEVVLHRWATRAS